MNKQHVLLVATGLVLAAQASWAHAQYSADATMDLGTGYGQTAMSQSILDGTRDIDSGNRSDRRTQRRAVQGTVRPTGFADRQALAQARAREIAPEYQRRVRMEGKASADRWLTRKAWEMGQRDGQIRRRAGDN
jgi:hypothetical protein